MTPNKEQQLLTLIGRIVGRLMPMPYLIDESNVEAQDALGALLVEIGIGVDEYINSNKCAVETCQHEPDNAKTAYSCGEIRFQCIKCGEFYR